MFYRTKKITYGMVGEIKPRLYNILMFQIPLPTAKLSYKRNRKKNPSICQLSVYQYTFIDN